MKELKEITQDTKSSEATGSKDLLYQKFNFHPESLVILFRKQEVL